MSTFSPRIRTARTDATWSPLVRSGAARRSGHRKSLHHGASSSRPRFSHEHHTDDKTLQNESTEVAKVYQTDWPSKDQDASDTGGGDSQDMLFIWETEQSLFSDLEEGPGASEEDRLDTLIDALHAPFEEKKKELKKQMAETFVPVMRHVKTLHQRIDERVDVPFGKGLKIFNSGCKTLEAATLAEYQEMVETYETTRANIANLLEQLKAEYAHRDNLWVNLEAQINELVDPAIAEIQDTPAQVERTIAKLEKYHQNMDKDGKDTTILSEKRLKELISKLG